MVRRFLLAGGRRFRARMMAERLSGPPGVYRKTGRLQRSLQYKTEASPKGYDLRASIGRGAPYAEDHEDRGRLHFQRIFDQEGKRTEEEIRLGLQILARNPARAGELSSGAASAVEAVAGGADAARAALLGELGAHFKAKRDARKARRAAQWSSIKEWLYPSERNRRSRPRVSPQDRIQGWLRREGVG